MSDAWEKFLRKEAIRVAANHGIIDRDSFAEDVVARYRRNDFNDIPGMLDEMLRSRLAGRRRKAT